MYQESFPYKTGFQLTFSKNDKQQDFEKVLLALRQNGFSNVELNLPDLGHIAPHALLNLLSSYRLEMNALATGAYAKQHNLSLCAQNASERKRAVEGCIENIDYAAELGSNIILGFFKGRLSDQSPYASECFLQSMEEIRPFAEKKQVKVLIEVTNHRETPVVQTLESGKQLLQRLNSPVFQLLADTYHMNIDEASINEALREYAPFYPHLHLSDDNRFLPGLGAIDFASIYQTLRNINYQGTVALEGNIKSSLLEDLAYSANYLHRVCALCPALAH